MERLYKRSSIVTCFVILVAIQFLSQNSFAKVPDWFVKMKQIKIFQSTRQDVERLFNYSNLKESGKSRGFQTVYYDIEGGSLTVGYSTGKCSEHPLSGFNIDENIVTRIDVYTRKAVKMSKFDIDISQFERYRESDDVAITWNNDNLGIKITGGETPKGVKLVSSVEFYPTIAQKNKITCPSS